MRFLLVIVILGWLLPQGYAAAQQRNVTQLPEAKVRHAITLALRNIHKALCGESFCAKATAEEVAKPLLPIAQARTAIETGVLSGTAEWCGLDWQRGLFLPMMDRFVKEFQPSERQRALFALVHGIYQGQTYGELRPRGPCPAEVRDGIAKRIKRAPV